MPSGRIGRQILSYNLQGFQRKAHTMALNGTDSLTIQQTGSEKSLCYQFPPVYTQTKAVIICPTISLMHDQLALLTAKGNAYNVYILAVPKQTNR